MIWNGLQWYNRWLLMVNKLQEYYNDFPINYDDIITSGQQTAIILR